MKPGAIERGHRPGCGCPYCTKTIVVKSAIDNGDTRRRIGFKVQEQIESILRLVDAETTGWFGGGEATDAPKVYHFGCKHPHTTKYDLRWFCRDCRRWFDTDPKQ